MGGAVLADMGDDYELVAFNRRPMEGVESIQGDISDFDAVNAALEGADGVVHLAALATFGMPDDPKSGTLPDFIQANIEGAYNVMEASRQNVRPCAL